MGRFSSVVSKLLRERMLKSLGLRQISTIPDVLNPEAYQDAAAEDGLHRASYDWHQKLGPIFK